MFSDICETGTWFLMDFCNFKVTNLRKIPKKRERGGEVQNAKCKMQSQNAKCKMQNEKSKCKMQS